METKHSLEELIELYNEAVAKNNNEAKQMISNAILKFSEMQALQSNIETNIKIARILISSGSV